MKANILFRFCSIFLALMLVIGLNGQDVKKKYNDKVILENGSVIIGQILEYDPENTLLIELKYGNTITLRQNQIKRIIMGGEKVKSQREYMPLQKKKIYHEARASILTGVSGTGLSVAYNTLYQFHDQISLGIGVGVDNYYVSPGRDIFPVYATGRYYLTQSNVSPYAGMAMGYGLAFKKLSEGVVEAEGGLMFNPEIGLRMGTGRVIMNVFIGTRFQKADYMMNNGWEERTEDIFFRRYNTGISIMF